jgi:4-hydroxy-2-oxoheptanedioate aldolase
MQPVKRLMERVRQGDVVVGLLVTDHLWTDLVEVSARNGIDYLIVDLEHGPHGPELVGEVCATGRRLGFPVLIRPRANDYMTLRHAIDLGCVGFLLAAVESTSELDIVRDAVRLPPRGRRRPGGLGNRWAENFRSEGWREAVEDDFIVLPQIETKVGMQQAEAIARHEMTTCLAVGPYDLSAELGVCGEMQSPVLHAALKTLQQIAASADKPMWTIGPRGDEMVRAGWRFICIGEPSAILASALRSKADEARGAL